MDCCLSIISLSPSHADFLMGGIYGLSGGTSRGFSCLTPWCWVSDWGLASSSLPQDPPTSSYCRASFAHWVARGVGIEKSLIFSHLLTFSQSPLTYPISVIPNANMQASPWIFSLTPIISLWPLPPCLSPKNRWPTSSVAQQFLIVCPQFLTYIWCHRRQLRHS